MAETTEKRLETWQNVARSSHWVRKQDRLGNLKAETIPPGKSFTISTEDRLLNSDMAYNPEQDLFKNGTFTPVRGITEDVEGYEEIASNPNLKSTSELEEMLGVQYQAFRKAIGEISNVQTLSRLSELAVSKDASIGKVKAIRERILEIEPTYIFPDEDTVQVVSAPPEGPPKRAVGGMP